MLIDDVAVALLDAATTGSGVTVAREVIAPGPLMANDCRLVAVWLASPRQVAGPGAPAAGVGLTAGCCATITVFDYMVRFVADCVPAPRNNGTPPPADEVTAWSRAYQADVQRINDALFETNLAPLGYSCSNLQVGSGIPNGPEGGTAWVDWPVTFSPA